MLCRAVVRPVATSRDGVTGLLDACFGEGHDGVWSEKVTVDGEHLVRGFIRREDDQLVVEANSVVRYERLLTTLREGLAIDFEIVDEKILSPRDALARQPSEDSGSMAPDTSDPGPELKEALRTFLREKEDAWVREHVPALGGLTPLQAADDPTRREDLIALLNEFEDREERVSDAIGTFDVERLRGLLGLSADAS
jgi:hypothetical protein